MKGFFQRYLVVDVSSGTSTIHPLDDNLLTQCLGGKGLATRLLLQHNPPGIDPLAPENTLIVGLGPANGSPLWGSCRYGIYTKSPQTGFYTESYSGGTAPEYIARTGFDAVLFQGASQQPVWIEITEKGAEFHDARELSGLDTFQTEDRIKEWIRTERGSKNCGVLTIGPAGENRVALSVIENDYWRSAGRTGAGAVIGAKGIKAMAFWGARKKELADPQGVSRFVKELARDAKDDAGVKAYNTMGTPMMVDVMSHVGSFPTRYWHQGKAAHKEQINAAALHDRLDVTPHACLHCFIACGRMATVKGGPYKGLKLEGPEYETIYAFGGLCEVQTIEEIAYLNDLCDRLGLDTISAGNLVGLAIEASRAGKINHPVDYGRTEQIAQLLQDMAHRRGVGEILARGILNASKEWNMETEAIHVKGLEPAGYDPRVLKGMGLAYGTSPRGACHMRATFYKPELAGMIDPDQTEGKAEMFAEWEDRITLMDTFIFCRFYRDLYLWDALSTMLRGLTGIELDRAGLRAAAAGIIDDTRRFNLREGLTVKDDLLPPRFHTETLPETGKVMPQEQMERLLKEYYRVRGWDEEGRPPGM